MSRAHTFKFCTNILAVNHQIHQECLKALKSNDFIVVTHESPLRSVTKHATSLPIVTENPEDCTSFRNYALSIDLRAAMATVQETDGSPPKGSFVMVAADLPRFCRVLQRALYDVPAITTYVYNDSADEALRRIAFTAPASDDDLPDIDFGTYLKIHFQEGQVTFELATKVLGAFQRVVHPNLQVSILNCPKGRGPDVIKLKEVMTPKAAWLKAMAWHILEYCQWELAEAKASAEAGHLQNAGVRFGGVVDLNSLMPLFLLPAELDEVYNSDAAIPIALLALTMLDAGVTENILRIRLAGMTYNKTRTITEALNSLCHFLIKLPNSVFAVALSMLGFKLTRTPPPPICRVLEHGWMMNITEDTVIENLANFDMHSSMLQGDAYFDNDYALIKKLAEDEDVSYCTTISCCMTLIWLLASLKSLIIRGSDP